MSKMRLAAAAGLALLAVTCEQVPLTAPAGTEMFLQANPPFVVANGGTSVVTALLTEPAGTLVPDGTVVLFFTTLGRIDAEGKTRNGVARVNFVADSRSGTATVTAYSGGPAPVPAPTASPASAAPVSASAHVAASAIGDVAALPTGSGTGNASITIDIGSALPFRVLVTADPQRITISRPASIVASVFDEVGNPVQNVPVVFSLGGDLIEETLASGGAQLFTDSSGQVRDTLSTRAPVGGLQKTVTVNATTANGIKGELTVFVN